MEILLKERDYFLCQFLIEIIDEKSKKISIFTSAPENLFQAKLISFTFIPGEDG
jgi:hypothetical protein